MAAGGSCCDRSARYYDPATGTFNRLDPFFGKVRDPQSLHKYLYAHGEPITHLDPSGLMTMGEVMSAMYSRMSIAVNHARTIYSAYSKVEGFIDIVQTVQSLLTVTLDPTLKTALWAAYNSYLGNLASSAIPDILKADFWKEAAMSFITNSGTLLSKMFAARTHVMIKGMFQKSNAKPRLVIHLPVPYNFPIANVLGIIPLPKKLSFRVGKEIVGMGVQFGMKVSKYGTVIGFSMQQRPGTPTNPIFRLDYGHHPEMFGEMNQPEEYVWPDSGSGYLFHYHVKKH